MLLLNKSICRRLRSTFYELLFVAVVKHHDQSNLSEKGTLDAYGSREMESIMAGKAGSSQGKHGGRNSKLAGYISSIHRKQRGNRKWSQAVKSQSLPPSGILPPARLRFLKVP